MSKERLEQALRNWQEQLAEYEHELSITSSSPQKFELRKRIEECEEEINRVKTKIESHQFGIPETEGRCRRPFPYELQYELKSAEGVDYTKRTQKSKSGDGSQTIQVAGDLHVGANRRFVRRSAASKKL